MNKEIIHTDKAPAAVGPYSQAVKVQNMVFCSGQIPINPQTGKLISDSIEKATSQCFENLKNVLLASGCTLDNVVKISVFLTLTSQEH